jgi:hypothetical protein
MWSFHVSDHENLAKLNIFQALFDGNGMRNSKIRKAWGNARSEIEKSPKNNEVFLPPRLMQCFTFLFQTILESLVIEEQNEIHIGGSDSPSSPGLVGQSDTINVKASE